MLLVFRGDLSYWQQYHVFLYIYIYIHQITCKYIMCCYTAIIYLYTCPGLSMKEYRWARSSIFRYSEKKIIIIFKTKTLIFLFNNFSVSHFCSQLRNIGQNPSNLFFYKRWLLPFFIYKCITFFIYKCIN